MAALAGTFQSILGAASIVPVVSGANEVNTALTTAGNVVVSILDPISTDRIFNPWAEGFTPASTDTLTDWLPSVKSVYAAVRDDQYWAPVARDLGTTVNGGTANDKVGQVTLELVVGPFNTVEASSVMTFRVSPAAVVLVAAGADTIGVVA